MDDVAARAGVSRALVSLVMRESAGVSAASREKVLRAARELGYRPNAMARSLAQRRTRTIGVLLSDLHNPFFAEVLDGIEPSATARGYRLLINTGYRNANAEAAAMETFLEFRVDGIITLGPLIDSADLVTTAASAPLVTVGRTIPDDAVDSVVVDGHAGARLAVDHLVELGHRDIAHIAADGAGGGSRRRGYEAAMRDAGLADRIVVMPASFDDDAAAKATAKLLDGRGLPTAIFAANDLMATGVLNRVEEGGLRVPDDVSVVGFDNTAIAALRQVSLTTIHQPRRDLGRLALEALLERVEDGRTDPVRHIVQPTLVARATTAPPPQGTS